MAMYSYWQSCVSDALGCGVLSVFIAVTPTLATGHAHHLSIHISLFLFPPSLLLFPSLSLHPPLSFSLSPFSLNSSPLSLPQDPDDVIEVESVHLADENRTYVDQDDEVAESLEDKETVSQSIITPSHSHTHTVTRSH